MVGTSALHQRDPDTQRQFHSHPNRTSPSWRGGGSPDRLRRLQHSEPDHYAALGLDRDCTVAQIRAAYRLLAKQHHPDVNPGSLDAPARIQALNAAHEILSDPAQRLAYDQARAASSKSRAPAHAAKFKRNIAQDVHLRIEDFLRGTTLDVRVNDPGNSSGPEIFQLTVPPETAPGTRFRLPRTTPFGGGFVVLRVRARADFRFKIRGADLRCELRISLQRATQGGTESVAGANGKRLRVQIPRGVARGEIIRLDGEGLPKPRGGCGDLLVRIGYQPEVRITRTSRR